MTFTIKYIICYSGCSSDVISHVNTIRGTIYKGAEIVTQTHAGLDIKKYTVRFD